MTEEKVREIGLRRKAERQGLVLLKSRRRDPHAPDFNRYMLRDARTGKILLGHPRSEGFYGSATIDQVEAYLNRTPKSRR